MNQQLAVTSAANLVDGKYSIRDIVDLDRLRALLEKFTQATGAAVALISYPEQEILASAGWRDICTKFHRANPESGAVCLQSNISMTAKATREGVLVIEPCAHGLVDGGVPVIIKGIRLATLATGQAFFHAPDMAQFGEQSRRFGYDTEKYLAAVRQVPVVSEAQFRATLSFLGELAELISEMGYYGLEMRDKTETLAREMDDRNRVQSAMRESERRYRSLFDNMSEGFAIHEIITDAAGQPVDYRFVDVNAAFERLTGLKRADLVGRTFNQVLPGDDPKWVRMYGAVALTGQPVRFENFSPVLLRDYEVFAYCPAPRQFAVVFMDVTARKQAEDKLRESEALLRAITDNTSDPIFLQDRGGRMLLANPACLAALGRRAEEVIGKTDAEFFDNPALGQAMLDHDLRVMESGQTETLEQVIPVANGLHTFLTSKTPYRDAQGQVIGVIGIAHDITARKQAEAALRESQALLQQAQVSAGMGAYSLDLPANVWRGTETLARLFGIEDGGQWSEADWAALVHPDDRDMMVNYFRNEVLGRVQPFDKEYRIIRQNDRAERWVHGMGKLECDAQGRPQRMHGMILDVTDRKQKELELGRLNRMLQALSDTNAALLHTDKEVDFLAAVCRVIVQDCGYAMVWIGYAEQNQAKSVRPMASAGFEKGYLQTMNLTWDDLARGRGPVGTAIRTGQFCVCQNMLTDPLFAPWREQAVQRGYASMISLPLISQGKVLGALNIYSPKIAPFVDEEADLLTKLAGALAYGITTLRARIARDQAEAQVRLHLAVIEAADNAIVITAPDGTIQWVNSAFARLTGYSATEVIGQNPRVLKSGTHDAAFYKNLWDTVTTGRVWHGELVNRRKDGSLYNEDMTITPVNNAAGKIEYFVAIKQDVTERRRAAEALRQSQQRLLEFTQNIQCALWEANVTGLPGWDDPTAGGTFTHALFAWDTNVVNPEVFRQLVDLPEVSGEAWQETFRLARQADEPRLYGIAARALQAGMTGYQMEYPILDRQGRVKHLHEVVSIHPRGPGRWQLYGIVTDITEHKHIEDALRQSELRYRNLFESMDEGFALCEMIYDPTGKAIDFRYLDVNPAFEKLTGLATAKVLGQQVTALIPGIEPFWIEQYAEVVRTGQSRRIVNELATLERHFEVYAYCPAPGRFAAIFTDITERKRIQDAFEESEARFRAIFEKAADGILVTDPTSLKFHSGNSRVCQMLGYAPEEICQLTVPDIHPAEDMPQIVRRFGHQWRGDNTMRKDVLTTRKDGSVFYADINSFPLTLQGKTYLVDFFRDVSERKQAEDETKQYQKRLRGLALELSLAEERERKRLATHIHDDLGQVLSAVKMRLSVLRQPCQQVDRTGEMKVIEDLMDMAIRSSRSLTGSLSHPALYDLGLVAAAEWLVEDVHKLYGLKVRLIKPPLPLPIDLRVRVLLFQSIRELLVNVAKHAKVPAATVRISAQGRTVRVVVQDRGRGFDISSLRSDARHAGFGLFSTRERLRDLGGRIDLRSTPGRGTTVRLTVHDAISKQETL